MHAYAAPLILLSGPTDIETLSIARHFLKLLPHTIAYPPLLVDDNVARDQAAIAIMFAERPRRSIVVITDAAHGTVGNVYRDAARRSGRVVIPVMLTNGEDSNEGREETEQLRFSTNEEIAIDVAGMETEDVAAKIARWVWWVGEFMSWGDDADGREQEEEECE
jgi:hypothetical protein